MLEEEAKAMARLVGDNDPSELNPDVLSRCIALVERPFGLGEPGETDRRSVTAEVGFFCGVGCAWPRSGYEG